MKTKDLMLFLKYAAIAGNVLFVLWILFNAMDEGFQGTWPEKVSAAGLIGLLTINCILILTRPQPKRV